jgi:hypothetical protein
MTRAGTYAFTVVLAVSPVSFLKPLPASAAEPANTSNIRVSIALNVEQLYQSALKLEDTWWEQGESGIHLARGIVVENDSPGCGKRDNDAGVFEEISGDVVISKELEITGPVPADVQLAFIGRERDKNQADLEFVINGKVVIRRPSTVWLPDAKQYEEGLGAPGGWTWGRWHYQVIPSEYLKTGKNHIEIRSRDGKPGWAIMVADYVDFYKGSLGTPIFPKTSAKSEDGGKTWRRDDLGSQSKISGEYVLRILLGSYRPSGLLLSPVIDAAEEGNATFKTWRILRNVRLTTETETAPGTHLLVEIRSGDSPVYDARHWGEWLSPGSDGRIGQVRGRYLQWRAKFATSDPLQSPQLKKITLDAEARAPGPHTHQVKIVREDNFELGEAPEGYTYEDYQSAYLKKFREHFHLDAVVAGAHTEWERQQRLLDWAYSVPIHEDRTIFPWDPQKWIREEYSQDGSFVMNKYPSRRRDQMCLFSAVVLIAALQSFGYPARHINLSSEGLSGHEIAEVWSNQFGKWVYLYPSWDMYWYEIKTAKPINTLEIHKVLADRVKDVETWQRPFVYTQQPETYLKNLPIAAADRYLPYSAEKDALDVFSTSSHLRMIPRSDVFSRLSPLPISEGQEIWCWDGYLNWADSKFPPLEHFTWYTNRDKDFNWPLNQVRYVAEETSEPGVVDVTLDNNMPYLASLLAKIDEGDWKRVDSRFQWRLHPGQNTLEVRGRNTAGVEGMTSSVILEYQR